MINKVVSKIILKECNRISKEIKCLECSKLKLFSALLQRVYNALSFENYGHAIRLLIILDKSLKKQKN
jgi:hypothetical protein